MDSLTRKLTELQFTPKQRALGDATVEVSIPKVDASWKKDTGFYIQPGGDGSISDRYPRMLSLVKQNQTMDQPEICLNDRHEVVFIDGRHRFSALRDLGHTRLKVSVPSTQADEFMARFS